MFGYTRGEKTVLIVDIDAASVGVAVVRTGAVPQILHFERESLKFETRTKEQAESTLIPLLERVATKVIAAHAAGKGLPLTGAYAIVRAPFTRFRTSRAINSFTESVVVSDAHIAELGRTAISSPPEADSTRLETGIVHVFVNGYPTTQPVGKRATKLSVIAYESDVQTGIEKSVRETLSRALPDRPIELRSSMSALLTVFIELFPESNRALCIDVGSVNTHCAVVLNESVTEALVINEGMLSMIARLSAGSIPEETLSQLRMLARDVCSIEACKALKDSLARIEPELAKIYGEAFAALSAHRHLPNTAFLSAPSEIAPWLAAFFARIDFAPFTATTQPLSVQVMTPDHLRPLVSFEETFSDTSMAIDAAYVNMLLLAKAK